MIDPIRLNSYIDQELTENEKIQLESELRECKLSQAEVESIRTIKSIVTVHSESHSCTQTWTVCVERLNGIDKARKTENFVSRYAWALCTGVFVTILVGGAMNRTKSISTSELPNMMSQFVPTRGADKELGERTKVYDEILGQAKQRLNAISVLNVSTAEFEGHHVEKYLLQDASGVIALFAVDADVATEGFIPMPQQGYESGLLGQTNCISWHHKGRTLLLAGERSYDSLMQAAVAHTVPPSN